MQAKPKNSLKQSGSNSSLIDQINNKNQQPSIIKPKPKNFSTKQNKGNDQNTPADNSVQSKIIQEPPIPDDETKYKTYIEQGDEYFNGTAPDYTVNFKKAAELYKMAADFGNIQGSIKYGNMLRYGLGMKINKEEAKKYYLRAATKGDQMGKKLFEIMEYQEKNLPKIPLGNSNSNQAETDQQEKKQFKSEPTIKLPTDPKGTPSPRNHK